MKILIDLSNFSKSRYGGKAEVAYNLLKGFSKLGYVKNIICVCGEDLVDTIKAIDPGYEIIVCNGKYYTAFHKMINHAKKFLSSGFKGARDKGAENYSKGTESNTDENKRPLFFLRAEWKLLGAEYARWLNKIVKERKLDLVLFTNKSRFVEKLKVPTVVIAHDVKGLYFGDDPVEILICKKTIKSADYVIAISEFDKNTMISKMPKYRNKYKMIYDPIYFESIKHTEDKYITVLNIQHEHKNPRTVIEAFGKIAKDTDLDLCLVGKMPGNADELKKCADDLALGSRISFTGFLPREEKDKIISKTRIFINSSLFEGFGMPAIEMMGNEIPVIVADNTSQKEVTLGAARYYAPANDSRTLADVITDEIKNPKSKEELKNISCKVKELYSYEKIANEYWQFMEECICYKVYPGRKKFDRNMF